MSVHPAHDTAFFLQMAGQREPYRRLADAIDAALAPTPGAICPQGSLLDLGCGVGCVTARLWERGWMAIGVDGAQAAQALKEDGVILLVRDLCDPEALRGFPVFDVVSCTETAEHLPADAAETLVAHCATKARSYIVWSAAPPGAEWPGHQNCQPGEFWLSLFEARGWLPDLMRTERLRHQMRLRKAQHDGGADTFYVLARR